MIASTALLAQTPAALHGKVTGPDGKPLPSASVVVTGSSGATKNTVTSSDGYFHVENLPPGPYHVDVQLSGYKSLSESNVHVDSPDHPVLELTMEPGDASDKIQVQGQVSSLQDDNATINRTYSSAGLTDIPVKDLNSQQLVEKMPGISPPVTFAASNPASSTATLFDPQGNRVWSANGQQPLANNQLLDGAENWEAVNGIAVHLPIGSAQQEMSVATSNYGAADGRAAGSILVPSVRGGTNKFHGEVFEFNSNNGFRARDYFDPKGSPQSKYVSNEFGGVIGGPIVRNHTFFFLAYEGDYLRSQNPQVGTVPTVAFANGDFSSLPFPIVNPLTNIPYNNNRIPISQQSLEARAITSFLPLPDVSGFENNYFANVPFNNSGNRVDARLDQHFNSSTAMSLHYGLSYYDTTQGAIFPGISADGGSSRLRAHDAMASVDHTFTPTTSTTFQLGYTRYSNPIYSLPSPFTGSQILLPTPFDGSSFGFTGGNGAIPFLQVTGMPALGVNPSEPQINKESSYSFRNTWRMNIHGNAITFGVDTWKIRADGFQNLPYGPGGAFTFRTWHDQPGSAAQRSASSPMPTQPSCWELQPPRV